MAKRKSSSQLQSKVVKKPRSTLFHSLNQFLLNPQHENHIMHAEQHHDTHDIFLAGSHAQDTAHLIVLNGMMKRYWKRYQGVCALHLVQNAELAQLHAATTQQMIDQACPMTGWTSTALTKQQKLKGLKMEFLRNRCHVLVLTPSTLDAFLSSKQKFNDMQYLVVDANVSREVMAQLKGSLRSLSFQTIVYSEEPSHASRAPKFQIDQSRKMMDVIEEGTKRKVTYKHIVAHHKDRFSSGIELIKQHETGKMVIYVNKKAMGFWQAFLAENDIELSAGVAQFRLAKTGIILLAMSCPFRFQDVDQYLWMEIPDPQQIHVPEYGKTDAKVSVVLLPEETEALQKLHAHIKLDRSYVDGKWMNEIKEFSRQSDFVKQLAEKAAHATQQSINYAREEHLKMSPLEKGDLLRYFGFSTRYQEEEEMVDTEK